MAINCAWESGEEIVKISATVSQSLYVLKQHTPWIDEESFKARKDKLQWLQDPNQMDGYLKNLRPAGSRHFSTQTRNYLETKMNGLGKNSINKNI
jgi:hypothetical protein